MVVEVIQLAKVLKACDSCLVGAPGGTQLLQCLKLCCQMQYRGGDWGGC